ncbi:hypothetical protein BDE02_19G000300 [Populus trichocarpa]|nr:hypothetical protein BDE02_19G000300 [Populus trichocarpa]
MAEPFWYLSTSKANVIMFTSAQSLYIGFKINCCSHLSSKWTSYCPHIQCPESLLNFRTLLHPVMVVFRVEEVRLLFQWMCSH